MMAKILILHTSTPMSEALSRTLSSPDRTCECAKTPLEALALSKQSVPDLAVLDVLMPWTSGSGLLSHVVRYRVPVIFLGCDRENMKHIENIYAGPCAVFGTAPQMAEILRSCRNFLSRKHARLSSGPLDLDAGTRKAFLNDEPLMLTGQEFDLLCALMSNPQKIHTRQELLRNAWGFQADGLTRTVDVHVQRLRQKLGMDSIETIYRMGYRLKSA